MSYTCSLFSHCSDTLLPQYVVHLYREIFTTPVPLSYEGKHMLEQITWCRVASLLQEIPVRGNNSPDKNQHI